MGYAVGIDLGTTFTAAARARDGSVTMATLGHRSTAIPTVAFATREGMLLVGDRAVNAGLADPSRRASEFKRRLGDTTPLLLGGQPYSPQVLLAGVLGEVIGQLSAEEGAPPDAVVVTHPANWGPYKRALLDDVVRLAGVDPDRVGYLTEPEAAAAWYAAGRHVPEGAYVVVYDLGGGTFDTAILSRRAGRFEILGEPAGIEHLGGIDIDHTVFSWLVERLAIDPSAPPPPDVQQRIARQRAACVEAKEALSAQDRVELINWLTEAPPVVALDRRHFEARIGPLVDQTTSVLARAIEASGLTPEEVTAVLLVGGVSRTPLVARRIGEVLGRPVAVDAHPKNAVALGAALEAARLARETPPVSLAVPRMATAAEPASSSPSGPGDRPAPPANAGRGPQPYAAPRRKLRRRGLLVAAAAVVSVAAAGAWQLWPRQHVLRSHQGVITAPVPAGWRLWENEPWDQPVADLGPIEIFAAPGAGPPLAFDVDPRPSLFVGLTGRHWGDRRPQELSADYSDGTFGPDRTRRGWNVRDDGGSLCAVRLVASTSTDVTFAYDCDQATVAGGFVQRAWTVADDEGPRIAIARVRYNDAAGLSRDEAERLLERIRIRPPLDDTPIFGSAG